MQIGFKPVTAFLLMPVTVVLAGCGPKVDDPGNPALLGSWTVETRVTSIGLNNMNFSRAGFVANGGEDMLKSIESSQVKACFEPAIKRDSDVIDSAENWFGDCAIVDSSGDAASRHATLTCERGGKTVAMTVDGTMGDQSGQANFSVRLSEVKPTGATESLSLRIAQTWTRTGDCA